MCKEICVCFTLYSNFTRLLTLHIAFTCLDLLCFIFKFELIILLNRNHREVCSVHDFTYD